MPLLPFLPDAFTGIKEDIVDSSILRDSRDENDTLTVRCYKVELKCALTSIAVCLVGAPCCFAHI